MSKTVILVGRKDRSNEIDWARMAVCDALNRFGVVEVINNNVDSGKILSIRALDRMEFSPAQQEAQRREQLSKP